MQSATLSRPVSSQEPLPAPPAEAEERGRVERAPDERSDEPSHPRLWTCFELVRLFLIALMVPTALSIPFAGVGAFAPATVLGMLYGIYILIELGQRMVDG